MATRIWSDYKGGGNNGKSSSKSGKKRASGIFGSYGNKDAISWWKKDDNSTILPYSDPKPDIKTDRKFSITINLPVIAAFVRDILLCILIWKFI